jgi:hypothetical protein
MRVDDDRVVHDEGSGGAARRWPMGNEGVRRIPTTVGGVTTVVEVVSPRSRGGVFWDSMGEGAPKFGTGTCDVVPLEASSAGRRRAGRLAGTALGIGLLCSSERSRERLGGKRVFHVAVQGRKGVCWVSICSWEGERDEEITPQECRRSF